MSTATGRDRGPTTQGSDELTTPARVASGGRLSQGVMVEASILARLLGIRLLKLDAQIVVLPAEPLGSTSVVVPAAVISTSGSVRTRNANSTAPIARSRGPDGGRSEFTVVGSGLLPPESSVRTARRRPITGTP
jgi:hypothetical protein